MIATKEEAFLAEAGEEVAARHPLGYYTVEESDCLLAWKHWIGWYTLGSFPSVTAWLAVGPVDKLPKLARRRAVHLYKVGVRGVCLCVDVVLVVRT
jgi:hypothetical protein